MAKMAIEGLDEYAFVIDRLGDKADEIKKKAIYEAAGYVADEIKKEMKKIPTENYRMGTSDKPMNVLTKKQKADLIESFGIAGFGMYKDTNFMNVKLGFDGYGSVKTQKYPKGVPNQLLARSVESGTTFRKKFPFVRKTINKCKKNAIRIMGEAIDSEIKKGMK